MRRSRAFACALALFGCALAWGTDALVTPEHAGTAAREIEQARALVLADPADAERHADRAAGLAGTIPDKGERLVLRSEADWLRAEARLSLNEPGDALSIADTALKRLPVPGTPAELTASLLRTRGFAEAMLARVEPALADFQRAYALFGISGNVRRQALTLQDIGAIYSDAGDYAHMLRYYRQSADLGVSDPSVQLAAHYNVALALGGMHRYRAAQDEFGRALALARVVHNRSYELRALCELGEAQVRNGDVGAAQLSALRALTLAREDTTITSWKPLVLSLMAQVDVARGDMTRAESDVREAFAGVALSRTDLSYRDLHELAVTVFKARGEPGLALAHLEALKRLDDQAQTIASNTNSALMSARFDFQNQDLRIARLKASQLEQAVQLEHASTRLHRIVFAVSASLGLALLALMSVALVSTRRNRNQIRAVNAELLRSNEALGRALKVKDEFLATTSHEIRTPLNGILGMTQVLLAERTLAHSVRDRIEVVHSAGQTMRALVDDILDVAKLENGSIEIHPEPVSLAALFREAGQLWSGEASRKGLAFHVDVGDVPVRILADEPRLRQILFNLLSNAIKFTRDGSVAMTASAKRGSDGEMLEVSVRDTGIGIAPELHELIFESFRQADSGTTREFGGTGLGLTICRRLATAMGGTVTVDSAAGEGATFTLRIPLLRAEDEDQAETCGDVPPASLDCSQILLVERNPLNRGILTALLAPACREIACAPSPEDALAHLAVRTADLILADASTLAEDAESLTEWVRVLGSGRTVLLAPASRTDLSPANTGARIVIAKPVAGAELIARLCALFAQGAQEECGGVSPGLLRSAAR